MTSDFTVTWQFSQREQLVFHYGSNSTHPGNPFKKLSRSAFFDEKSIPFHERFPK
jgi:hypothetical protein